MPNNTYELSGKSKLYITAGLIIWWYMADFSMVAEGEVAPVLYLLLCTVAWVGYLIYLKVRPVPEVIDEADSIVIVDTVPNYSNTIMNTVSQDQRKRDAE